MTLFAQASKGVLSAGAVLALAAAPALAQVSTFTATLSGANERPTPTGSMATGFGTVTLDAGANMLTVDETWSGLAAGATGAHIHCCASSNATAPVAVDFISNMFPVGATSGSYMHTFDLMNANTYSSRYLMLLGSVTAARDAVVTGMLGGEAYLNIHDASYPTGEIRGQLIATPEPSTYALIATGLGAVGMVARRRRQG